MIVIKGAKQKNHMGMTYVSQDGRIRTVAEPRR